MASVAQIVRRRRQRRLRRRAQRSRRRVWSGFLVFLGILVIIGPLTVVLGYVGSVYARALDALPDDPKQNLDLDPVIGGSQFYDSSGQTLLFTMEAPFSGERVWLTLDELPEEVALATVMWEDPGFLSSTHFSPFQSLRQLLDDLRYRVLEEDRALTDSSFQHDSSLTGKLVRNVLLSNQNDNALEIALIAEINRRYSPEEVLEWHLNTNYYGNGAYGIEAAAQTYLGKPARDLTLDEIALLVAIPTKPEHNPVDDETAARGRQGQLLRQMLANEYITPSEFEQAGSVLTLIRPDAGQTPLIAPEFSAYARRQAEDILGLLNYPDSVQMLSRGGLRITTTLDLDLYLQAECMLRTHLADLAGDSASITALDGNQCFGAIYLPTDNADGGINPPDTGVVVVMDVATDKILAMIGPGAAVDYQPGPVLHPFVYLNGLLNSSPNFTLADMLLDVSRPFPGAADGLLYVPTNLDGQFHGPLSLRDAMGAGLLPPVFEVANKLNLNDVINETAHLIGINSLHDGVYDLTLLDRGGAVSVLDMTYAYATFADLGWVGGLPRPDEPYGRNFRKRDPVAVLRIEDANGNVLWDYNEEQIAASLENLLQEQAAFLITDVLADPDPKRMVLGENTLLQFPGQSAVVNGLTGDRLDNWTIGYTSHLVTSVHLGRADDTGLSLDGYGIEGSASLWRGVMEYVHARDGLSASEWQRPDNILETNVCEISGMSPNDACPTRTEMFLDAGHIPSVDTFWELVEVNTQTNLRATANTPAALRNTREYFVPPDEAMDWWQTNNRPLPPAQYDTLSRPDIVSDAVILQPAPLEIIGGEVVIMGSINSENMEYYQLSYGEGPNPDEWIAITGQQQTYTPGVALGTWDTSTLDGIHWLQLNVVMNDNTFQSEAIPVSVDNIPPTIVLHVGEPDRIYSWPGDEVISLTVDVADNISVDRVEFYYNGQYMGTVEEHPYDYRHQINRAGIEVFGAVVYDAVGLSSQSEAQVEVVSSGG